jgi:hypothetical protein
VAQIDMTCLLLYIGYIDRAARVAIHNRMCTWSLNGTGTRICMAILTSSNDHVDIETGFPTTNRAAHAREQHMVVVNNPMLADLIYCSCVSTAPRLASSPSTPLFHVARLYLPVSFFFLSARTLPLPCSSSSSSRPLLLASGITVFVG